MKGKSAAIIGFLFFFVQASISSESPRYLWSRTHHFGESDYAVGLQIDSQGAVFHLWRSHTNSFLTKYTGSGAVLWQKELPAELTFVVLDDGEHPVVSGEAVYLDGSTTRKEIYTAKLSGSSGSLIWEQRYRNPEAANTRVRNLILDPNGNAIVLAGYKAGDELYARLLDYASANGSSNWQIKIDNVNPGPEPSAALAVGSDGDVAIAGTLSSSFYIARINGENGDIRWESTLAHTNVLGFASDITFDPQGNIAFTGSSTWGLREGIMGTAKFAAANGQLLWQRWNPGPPWNQAFGWRILSCEDGDIIAAGSESHSDGQSASEVYIARYDSLSGNVVWENTYGISGRLDGVREDLIALLPTQNGNFLIGLSAPGFSLTSWRSSTLEVDSSNAAIRWELVHSNLYATATVFRSTGVLALAGQAEGGQEENQAGAFIQVFRSGPELNAQVIEGGNIEIEWPAEYSGWLLQKLNSPLNAATLQWTPIAGSRETNKVTLPLESDPQAFFQLVP